MRRGRSVRARNALASNLEMRGQAFLPGSGGRGWVWARQEVPGQTTIGHHLENKTL